MHKFHGDSKYFDIDIKPLSASASLNDMGPVRKATDVTNNEKFESLTLVDPNSTNETPRLYKRRWLILAVYSLTFIINVFHLTFYDDLQDSLNSFYYSNSDEDVVEKRGTKINWIALIHLTYNFLFILPAMFILEHKGFRSCFLIGSVFTALGSWIKCNSIHSNLFPILLIGQITCGIGFCFIQTCLVKMSALWFGKSELATTIAVKLTKFIFLLSLYYKFL
jgi:hypothetical protein